MGLSRQTQAGYALRKYALDRLGLAWLALICFAYTTLDMRFQVRATLLLLLAGWDGMVELTSFIWGGACEVFL